MRAALDGYESTTADVSKTSAAHGQRLASKTFPVAAATSRRWTQMMRRPIDMVRIAFVRWLAFYTVLGLTLWAMSH
jgi:hypothetical protein